jgi:uncharacterized repeat protein (TIGR01451 family)
VIFNVPSLAAGKSITNVILYTSVQSGYATNVASVGGALPDTSTANNILTNVVLVNGEDLALGMTASPSNIDIGGAVTYTLYVTNLGPADNGLIYVTNSLTTDLGLVTNVIQSQGTYSVVGTNVIFNLGTLATNTFATITFTATALSVNNSTNATNTAIAIS